jgi:CHAT domain-containing protein
MVDMHARGCLDPEVLAAYVDHGLSLAERARVESHLASCPQCTALLAGVVRTVAEIAPSLPHLAEPVEASPLLTRRAVAVAAVAAAAVFAVVAAPSLLKPWFNRDAGLVGLAGTVGEHRSVLGRLTGGYPHAPLDAASAGGQDVRASGPDHVRLTAGRIRESVGEVATPSRLHALGVSQLFERRYDDAAELLLAASRQQPANARYLNDVATVQLERARLGLRPDDLPRALAAADRARRLEPSLHEAWFNRALAMSALQLTDQARTAWTEYLRRDSSSPWAVEARKHLEDLSKPTPAAAWAEIATRLEQHIDSATADAAVRAQTTEARNFVENKLIVGWADAVLAGNAGDAELDRLRLMAESMFRIAGDAIYTDIASLIGRTINPQAKLQLARAHREFARGSALFNQDRFGDAAPIIANALAELRTAGSPAAVIGDVQLAAIQYVDGKLEQSDKNLAAAHATAVSRNYLYVAARATWFRGLVAFAQGRPNESQVFYEDTLATFERMGDVEQAAMTHGLLSGVHFTLGNSASEWEHRRRGLVGLHNAASTRFKYSVLLTGALSIRATNPEAALFLFDGVIAAARESGRNAALVEALAQRAATLVQIGLSTEAQATVDEARRQLATIADQSFRQVFEIPVLAVESDLLRSTNPRAAVQTAQRAVEAATARGQLIRLPQLHLRVAKANVVWGRLEEAERALLAGIAAFDAMRIRQATAVTANDESWQLFETAVQVAMRRGDYDRAFAMAERGRSNLSVSNVSPLSLVEIRKAQRAGDAIVALNQFDDELAVWVIRPDGTHVVRRPVSKTDARRIVARQQDEIRLETRFASASAALYDEIVRPVAAHLSGVNRVVFVPDQTYQDVSFAALWDRSADRFLVERFTVSASPAVSLVASVTAQRAGTVNSILVVAASGDANVASRITGEYRAVDAAVGPDATRARVLDSTHAVLHVAAPTRRNTEYPSWSRIVLSDEQGRRYSGTLSARDIAGRQLSATHLVVLDEVRAEQNYRTAGTVDLATAFLAAGVPAVLGTLPGADERNTRELIVGFHRHLAPQVPAAEALAQVQRNALQQNGRRVGAWTALVIYGSDR